MKLWIWLRCKLTGHVDEFCIETDALRLMCVRCGDRSPGIETRISRTLRFQRRLFLDQRRRRAQA